MDPLVCDENVIAARLLKIRTANLITPSMTTILQHFSSVIMAETVITSSFEREAQLRLRFLNDITDIKCI